MDLRKANLRPDEAANRERLRRWDRARRNYSPMDLQPPDNLPRTTFNETRYIKLRNDQLLMPPSATTDDWDCDSDEISFYCEVLKLFFIA